MDSRCGNHATSVPLFRQSAGLVELWWKKVIILSVLSGGQSQSGKERGKEVGCSAAAVAEKNKLAWPQAEEKSFSEVEEFSSLVDR